MFRMYGIPWAQGCAGAVMFRMYGIPWAQGCAGAVMFRMYGSVFASAKRTLPPPLAVVFRGRVVQGCAGVDMFRAVHIYLRRVHWQ